VRHSVACGCPFSRNEGQSFQGCIQDGTACGHTCAANTCVAEIPNIIVQTVEPKPLGRMPRLLPGHEGPVYSVCPHVKGNICFVFSTGRDGRIKAWLYDSQVAAVVDYSAEGVLVSPAMHMRK